MIAFKRRAPCTTSFELQRQSEASATRGVPQSRSGITPAPSESLSIAVLPFGVRGAHADAEAVAVGLTEDITASLAKFPVCR